MKHIHMISIMIGLLLLLSSISGILHDTPHTTARADDAYAVNLAEAILSNASCLTSATYQETTYQGTYQSAIVNNLGTLHPTDGDTFVIFSTGIAAANPVTTSTTNPGDERGSWFRNDQYQHTSIDLARLTMTLTVPTYMHNIYYDMQFLTSEYPDYIGTSYNDGVTVTITTTDETFTDIIDVNGGDFVLNSHDIPGTGFDIFAIDERTHQPTSPSNVDWVTTTPNSIGADGGATALVGRQHPVTPGETITVTIEIRDNKDNQFDSAVLLDGMQFTGYAKTDIIARKTVIDTNGDYAEPEDELEYTLTISNIGNAQQYDNPGPELEDILPPYLNYTTGSLSSTAGIATYHQENHTITWNGDIPPESSVAVTFQGTISGDAPAGTILSNQGSVNWDTDEDHINDNIELTDDPSIDDGIDSDGDGQTDDDDPTSLTVTTLETPESITETFSDDTPGGAAHQNHLSFNWFETTATSTNGSFYVAGSYYYQSTHSYKTKIRASCEPQYWIYHPEHLNAKIHKWEVWFACGNGSEESDLILTLQDNAGQTITAVKIDYLQSGTTPPTDYIPHMSIQTASGWQKLNSGHATGELYNGWYKLTISYADPIRIDVSLTQPGLGITDNDTILLSGPSFDTLSAVKWTSTKTPTICPLIFWDEHTLGLTAIS